MKSLLALLLTAILATHAAATNALHLGFMEGAAGNEIEIPVYHSGDDAVGGLSVDFQFDPARMEFIETLAGAAADGWTLDSEQTTVHQVRLMLTHPSGAQVPQGEVTRVKVRLLETFADSESTGTALDRRETASPAAQLGTALWLPWIEITAPAPHTLLSNTAPAQVSFRLTPGEHPITALALQVEGQPVLTAPSPADRVFDWLPNLNASGLLELTVAATDEESHVSTSVGLSVVLNTPPVLVHPGDRSVDELTTLAFTISATDPDLPPDPLTYSLVDPPAGAAIDPVSGAFSWTPSETQGPETYTITVRVDDGMHNDQTTFQVTVNEVNAAPELAAISNQTVNEGSALTFTASASDDDFPANPLTYSLDAGAPSGTSIHPTTGVFSWTPSEAQGPGTYPINIRVTDSNPQAVNSTSLSATRGFTVTVHEINTAPTLAAITDKTVNEGTALSFTAAGADSDLPTNALIYSFGAGAPSGASIHPSTGAFTWTPTEAQGPGTYPITIRVSDSNPQAVNPTSLTASRTFSVTVNEVNSAPILAAISDQQANLGSTLAFSASATDSDLPANSLAFSLTSAPSGATIHPTSGSFVWTPDTGGTYHITVTVTDNGISPLSDSRTFRVDVNVPPVFVTHPLDQTVVRDQAAVFTAEASGMPEPTYLWQRRPAGTTLWSNLSEDDTYSGVASTVLTVHATTTTMSGDRFRCVATNTAAAATSYSATLKVNRVPPNDMFVDAIPVTGQSTSVTGSNFNATKETGEPDHAGNSGGRSVWWLWLAPASGTATIDTVGSDFDTLLAVHAGENVGVLTQVAADDDSGGNYTSSLEFKAIAGTTYRIAVDGYGGAMGEIVLNFSLDSGGLADPHGDTDGDGISNLLEYAFGLDPTRNSAGLLPKPERVGGNLVLTVTQPAEVTGITYGAEWSNTLLPGFWTEIPNTGTVPQHIFSVPMAGKPKLFLRWKITIP